MSKQRSRARRQRKDPSRPPQLIGGGWVRTVLSRDRIRFQHVSTGSEFHTNEPSIRTGVQATQAFKAALEREAQQRVEQDSPKPKPAEWMVDSASPTGAANR